jgi:hypothetical protein
MMAENPTNPRRAEALHRVRLRPGRDAARMIQSFRLYFLGKNASVNSFVMSGSLSST